MSARPRRALRVLGTLAAGIALLTWLPLRGWDCEPYGLVRENGVWTERGAPRSGLSLVLATHAATARTTTSRASEAPHPRRLWITAVEDHPLLQELATHLVDSLREVELLEEVGWFPANTQPLQVRRAPDAWVILDLQELETLTLPLYQRLRAEVHLTVDSSLVKRSARSQRPPALSVLLRRDSTSVGLVTEAARWKAAGQALAEAVDLAGELAELGDPGPPPLPRAEGPPPAPPADLGAALEAHGRRLWTTPAPGGLHRTRWVLDPPPQPEDLGATLEQLGFQAAPSVQPALLRWTRGASERLALRVLGPNQPFEGGHIIPWRPEREPEVRFVELEVGPAQDAAPQDGAPEGPRLRAPAADEEAQRVLEVSELLAKARLDGTTPCAVAAWGRLGQPTTTLSSGALTYDEGAPPARVSTVFDLASLTKVVSSTTLALLHERRGTWSLDDPLVEHLPAFAGEDPRRDEVRLHHLLRHTAGLPAWLPLYRTHEGRDALVAAAAAAPLEGEPGAERRYSDLGLILLGAALEAATDRTLEQLEQEELFEPLGMATATRQPGREGVAPTEVPPEGGAAWVGVVHDENARAAGGVVGHAGLFASAQDLSGFAEEWLWARHGQGKVLTPEDLARVRDSGGEGPWIGWRDGGEGRERTLHHTGFTGTALWIDPEGDRFALLLTNRVHPTRDGSGIRELRKAFLELVLPASPR